MPSDLIERAKEALEGATPGPWWTDGRYSGREMGCAIIAARTDSGPLPGNPTRGMVAWASAVLNTEARRCESNARLIALSPDLARLAVAAGELADCIDAHQAVYQGMMPQTLKALDRFRAISEGKE